MLDFFSKNKVQKSDSYTTSKLRSQDYLELLYANELILSVINQQINSSVLESVRNYIKEMSKISIGIFAGLQLIMFTLMLYFFLHLYRKMRKDMLSSHTMLAMLPKHLLPKSE